MVKNIGHIVKIPCGGHDRLQCGFRYGETLLCITAVGLYRVGEIIGEKRLCALEIGVLWHTQNRIDVSV